jgi:phosphopantothenoylcysteine decarboxylase/phosphopantothenate--cysteine ligase
MNRLRFVVTAGPTREHIDPVRFLSNPSTGKMGFAVARAAAAHGHDVTLVAGPVSLRTPKGVRRVDVVSAREMMDAVERALREGAVTRGARPDVVLVATAAVADWRPAECAARKLKKGEMSGTLRLVRNPDILKAVRCARKVGFAAETNDVLAEARRKCREKGLEMIVANDVTEKGSGFGTDTNRVVFVRRDGSAERLPLMSKLSVARRLVREIEGRSAPQ